MRLRTIALVFAAALASGLIAGGIAATLTPAPPAEAPHGDAAAAAAGGPALRGAVEAFRLYDAPRELPALRFRDASDRDVTLADFRGRVVLLNLWATWCAPCLDEMPALQRLQQALGGDAFTVLALSIDRQGRRLVEPFLQRLDLTQLPVYLDPSGAVARALTVPGLPTTLLIDRDGRELGRIAGTAQWDGEAAAGLIRFALGLPSMPGALGAPGTPAPRPAPAAPAAPAPDAMPLPPIERLPDLPGADRAEGPAASGGRLI